MSKSKAKKKSLSASAPRRKVVITGASSGIGYATACVLAERGFDLLLVARRADRLKKIAAELSKYASVKTATLDLNDAGAVDKFVIKNKEWLKDVDVLINNAGLALGRDLFQRSQFEDTETMIQTNITALLRFTHKILPFMLPHKAGHILNLGSIAGKTAYTAGTVYCATKAAVHMLTDCLRYDLGGTGLRVSTVAPGRVNDTDFAIVRFKGDKAKADQVYEGYRSLTAKDVAETICWIISQPEHVNIQEVVIMPTDQPSATALAPLK